MGTLSWPVTPCCLAFTMYIVFFGRCSKMNCVIFMIKLFFWFIPLISVSCLLQINLYKPNVCQYWDIQKEQSCLDLTAKSLFRVLIYFKGVLLPGVLWSVHAAPCRWSARNFLKVLGWYPAKPAGTYKMKRVTCSVSKPTRTAEVTQNRKFDATFLDFTTLLLEFWFVDHSIPSIVQNLQST